MSFKAGEPVWARSDGSAVPAGWCAGVVIGPNSDYVSKVDARRPVYTVHVFDYPRPLWAVTEGGLRPRWQDGDSSARGDWSKIPWTPSRQRPVVRYESLPDGILGSRRVPVRLRRFL